ncbi:alpha-galactosidase [Mucilaginibacter pedocola]|uniref:Alpha-galactosidase n=1 Tax=Mucilaginibacter pedocola TaxID=1792845 RepID=A0A1S9PDL6_9SPHI|nr:alpha-galactosidase [Mucilaginibacter pedocola]OOQ59061.1 alpha-galactosidase [Mucilaginibacter pedocola]
MFKLYICYAASFLFALIFVFKAGAKPPAALINIAFGKSGVIKYNLKTGTYTVVQQGQEVFAGIYAVAKINADTLSTKNYEIRQYNKIAIADGFGKGVKHTIVLTAPGKPIMKQVFYTYPGRNYFFTEVCFKGTALTTNYMMPFIGHCKPLTGGDVRSLFVPFDNDTFIRYGSKAFGASPQTSAEVGVVYSNDSRNGIIAGSVEHELWKTGVETQANATAGQIKVWGGYSAEAVTRDKIPHGIISGNVVKSPKVFVGSFADWREGMDEYGKANRIAEPPFVFNWTKPTPVGWNSWGVIQEHIDFDKALKVADFFADSIPAFRTGNTAYIDLDSYWDKMVSHGDYSKLKEWADHCKSKGLEPGIYWAPFTDWGHAGGPDRIADGGNYKFGDMWTKTGNGYHDLDGARALDPTHPGTKARIAYIIGKFKECGFKMIKIDFLGHGAIEANHFYDPKVTTGMQAYKAGMEYLIKQMDNQMLVYAAISPSLASGRYVHMRRIACDAFKTIEHTEYTLNSVSYGWWQTHLYNYLDADHVVFNNEAEGANRARLLSALVTGTWISGDDFSKHGQWTERVKHYYQNPELLKLVKDGKSFSPADGDAKTDAAEVFTKQVGKTFYVAVFNYDKAARNYSLSYARLGLPAGKILSVKEVLQNNAIELNSNIQLKLDGADAALYKFILK